MREDDLHQSENKAEIPENPVSMQQYLPEGMAEDELIDIVATRVLKKYRAAFEVLAK